MGEKMGHYVQICLIKSIMGCKWAMETMLRLIGPIFVLIAITLLLGVTYVFFMAILPTHVEWFSVGWFLHFAVDVFLAQGVTLNYLWSIFTPPGSPPKLTEEEQARLQSDLGREKAPRKGEGFSKWCKACKAPKPQRTHHCHVCKRCVLKMDHHCPWINNCVGHYNHRNFVLFLVYLWATCAYGALMSYAPFHGSANFKVPWSGLSGRGTIIFFFVLSVAVGLAMSLMLVWQLYLVLTGQTTIEFYFNRFKASEAKKRGTTYTNPFDLGYKENWLYLFGVPRQGWWFKWLLPTTKPPPGDGITYPTNASAKRDGNPWDDPVLRAEAKLERRLEDFV